MSSHAPEPAPPMLAHLLMSQSVDVGIDTTEGTRHSGPKGPGTSIEEGVQCSSSDALFRCGMIVGFSGLRKKCRDDGNDHESVGQIPRNILTNNLRKGPCPASSSSSSSSSELHNTFIIHPVHYDVFSPQNLLTSLLSPANSVSLSHKEAISRLDSVQLLPVFDFPAAMQAINQVSDTLHRVEKDRLDHQRPGEQVNHRPVILVIAGLDTLVEGVIRASNPVKGTAVLNAALRTITRLSRSYASFLSIMLVNTSGLGLGSGAGQQPPTTTNADDGHQGGDGGELRLSSLLPSLLSKTLDQGIDTHLLVSALGRAGEVIEVVKDRVGEGLGKQYAWNKS